MRVLYAYRHTKQSKQQLSRFLYEIQDLDLELRIAGYADEIKAFPHRLDWNLWGASDVRQTSWHKYGDGGFSTTLPHQNSEFEVFKAQVKRFSPALIISDFEPISMEVARQLSIPYVVLSTSLIGYGITCHFETKHVIPKKTNVIQDHEMLCFLASKGNYIYSHFGDTIFPPKLHDHFRFCRPATIPRASSKQEPIFDSIHMLLFPNKERLQAIEKDRSYLLSTATKQYAGFRSSSIFDYELATDFVSMSRKAVCEPNMLMLSDLFYSGKFANVYPTSDPTPESLQNSDDAVISRLVSLSKTGAILTKDQPFTDGQVSAIIPRPCPTIPQIIQRFR
jgi:hypothetical protein